MLPTKENEAITILRYITKDKRLLNDPDIIGTVQSKLIEAEQNYNPSKGKLSTIKFAYIKNFIFNETRNFNRKKLKIKFANLVEIPAKQTYNMEDFRDFINRFNLTLEQKNLLELKFVEGLSTSEISKITKSNSISARLNYIYKKIKKQLKGDSHVCKMF